MTYSFVFLLNDKFLGLRCEHLYLSLMWFLMHLVLIYNHTKALEDLIFIYLDLSIIATINL